MSSYLVSAMAPQPPVQGGAAPLAVRNGAFVVRTPAGDLRISPARQDIAHDLQNGLMKAGRFTTSGRGGMPAPASPRHAAALKRARMALAAAGPVIARAARTATPSPSSSPLSPAQMRALDRAPMSVVIDSIGETLGAELRLRDQRIARLEAQAVKSNPMAVFERARAALRNAEAAL